MNVQTSNVTCAGIVIIDGNRTESSGGGINAHLNSSVSFLGRAIFMKNSTVQGGALDSDDSYLNCRGSTLLYNNEDLLIL